MKAKLYIETTIPSYLTARLSRDLIVAAHQKITQEWWNKRRESFNIFISQFVIDETSKGNIEAAKRRLDILSEFDLLDITNEVKVLANDIIDSRIIPQKSAIDAAHIAIATVHKMQFLLTWNCTHIANAENYDPIKAICSLKGLKCPVICTPEELMGESENV